MGIGCRSSGVLTAASNAIFSGQCKLVSIHAVATGSNATTIKVFDNTAASGTEIARLIVGGSNAPHTTEFDMHGVICGTGIFATISAGTGESAAISIEFS